MIEKAQGKEEHQGRGHHFDSRQQLGGDWRIGIVSDAHPSHDNKVQQFTVSYKNGVRVTLQST